MLRTLLTAGLAVTAAVVPASGAFADTGGVSLPDFPDTCTAESIASADVACDTGLVEVTLASDGSASWMRETGYPRQAFEDYLTEYAQWTDGLDSYLETELASIELDGAAVDTIVTDDAVRVRITTELSAGEQALLMGIALAEDGDLYTAIDPEQAYEVDVFTITAPGEILETNGSVSGMTAVWTADEIAALDEIALHAEASVPPAVPVWAWFGLGGLGVVLGVAIYFGFMRRGPEPDQD